MSFTKSTNELNKPEQQNVRGMRSNFHHQTAAACINIQQSRQLAEDALAAGYQGRLIMARCLARGEGRRCREETFEAGGGGDGRAWFRGCSWWRSWSPCEAPSRQTPSARANAGKAVSQKLAVCPQKRQYIPRQLLHPSQKAQQWLNLFILTPFSFTNCWFRKQAANILPQQNQYFMEAFVMEGKFYILRGRARDDGEGGTRRGGTRKGQNHEEVKEWVEENDKGFFGKNGRLGWRTVEKITEFPVMYFIYLIQLMQLNSSEIATV